MNTTSARLVRRTLLQLATGLSLLASSVAFAQTNPFQRGPNPTDASLEAAAGSYAIKNVRITSPQGFNGGLVYYPSGATQEAGTASESSTPTTTPPEVPPLVVMAKDRKAILA